MNQDDKEYAIGIGCLVLVVIGIFTFIGTVYYGIYHLLDKLIDKL